MPLPSLSADDVLQLFGDRAEVLVIGYGHWVWASVIKSVKQLHTNRCYLYYRKLTTVPSKKCGSVLTNPDFFTRDRSKIPGNIDNTGLYQLETG